MTETVRAVVAALERDPRRRRSSAPRSWAPGGTRGDPLPARPRRRRGTGGCRASRRRGDRARALRGASDAGYAAVRNPQEGTMLTVARALAERAEALAADPPVAEALAELVAHGEEALAATTDQLDILREGRRGRRGRGRRARDPARNRGARPRRAAPEARGGHGRDPARGRASGALPLPLLHVVLRRGRDGRSRGARARADEARRLAPRRRRPGRGQGARAHGRARRRSRARDRARRDRGGRHQEHARPDRGPHRAAGARGRRTGAVAVALGDGNGGSSRAWARPRSRAARR